MNILSFDPGETTGIAAIQSGEWVMGLTVSTQGLTPLFFSLLTEMVNPHVIVMEALPKNIATIQPARNFYTIEEWFLQRGFSIEQVNPGQWKGMTKRVSISGTHQMDAATMGMWYYRSRLVNSLGA